MVKIHQSLINSRQQFAFIQRQRPAVALFCQMRAQCGNVIE
jgi:hypothetical protein